METPQSPKQKHPTKLVRIDETTWIETKVEIPDEIARKKFLDKLTKALNAQNVAPLLKGA